MHNSARQFARFLTLDLRDDSDLRLHELNHGAGKPKIAPNTNPHKSPWSQGVIASGDLKLRPTCRVTATRSSPRWTGWIASHNRRKHALLAELEQSRVRNLLGFALLGFSSFYREGVEVVLFLHSYRLRVGPQIIHDGVLIGSLSALLVGILTFVAHKKLPYKRMLVLTGMLLGVVLFVMVGEQVQEMQIVHWLGASPIPWLEEHLPEWTGLWFSIFPTVECLVGQSLAMSLVIGSYLAARDRLTTA